MARNFNGSTQNAQSSTNAALTVVDDCTFCYTANYNALPGSGRIWAMSGVPPEDGSDNENTNHCWMGGVSFSGGSVYVAAFHENGSGVNNNVDFTSGPTLSTGTLYRICIIRDISANTYRLIVNGTDYGTESYANDPTCTGTARVTFAENGKAQQYSNVILSEGLLYNSTLTSAQGIAYTLGYSWELISDQVPIGYWEMMGNDSPEPDLVNGHDLTLGNSPTKAAHPTITYPSAEIISFPTAAAPAGRIMSSLANHGGLAGKGGIAGQGGGLAG